MELTANEILEKHGVRIFGAQQERILAAMKEAVELAFVAGQNYEYAGFFGMVPNKYPNKTEFINSLFPESK